MIYFNADDFGKSKEINEAINNCFDLNILYRTSLMVNMNSAIDAMELAKKNGYLDRVCLHLNLTEGVPLTEEIKNTIFCDDNGKFCKAILETKNILRPLETYTQKALQKEIIAQINRFKELGGVLMHLDSHHHIHTNANLYKFIGRLILKYEFSSVRVVRNIPENKNIIKKEYKRMINGFFIKKNLLSDKDSFFYFADIKDLDKIATSIFQQKKIEVMTHPIMNDNEIIDSMTGIRLLQIKELYKDYIISGKGLRR